MQLVFSPAAYGRPGIPSDSQVLAPANFIESLRTACASLQNSLTAAIDHCSLEIAGAHTALHQKQLVISELDEQITEAAAAQQNRAVFDSRSPIVEQKQAALVSAEGALKCSSDAVGRLQQAIKLKEGEIQALGAQRAAYEASVAKVKRECVSTIEKSLGVLNAHKLSVFTVFEDLRAWTGSNFAWLNE